MIFDKNHNEVKIGSWVKVLFIEPGFISTFPLSEAKIMKAMINKTFKVIVIFTRFYGHTAKRVISNSEVTNENQERRRRPI